MRKASLTVIDQTSLEAATGGIQTASAPGSLPRLLEIGSSESGLGGLISNEGIIKVWNAERRRRKSG